jgi:Peptidase family M23
MQKSHFLSAPFIVVVIVIVGALAAHAHATTDQFTPLIAAPATSNAYPVLGTDGRLHIVYELMLTNTNPTPATLKKLEVVDASDPSKVLASYEGQDLVARSRTSGGGAIDSPIFELNNTRLFLIDFTLDGSATPPARLMHRFEILGAPGPDRRPTTPVLLSYTVAPINLVRKLRVLSPPLSGKGWVSANGCCTAAGVHRSSSLTVNGKIHYAQRFAIDWMLLGKDGRLVHDDDKNVHNYPGYGANVLAVADGTVISTLNTMDDQAPPSMPDPKTINLSNVDGNHIVLDLGDGVYALYAHLQNGSVRVTEGAHVKRGEVMAILGNTGNSSGPHLHFHLMDSPSVLGSSGIPYVFDSFELAGQVPESEFAKVEGVEGDFSRGLLAKPAPRKNEFPLDMNIINFPEAK